MSVRSIDTNILLRLLLRDHEEHYRAVLALIEGSPPASLYISDVAVCEAVWIMQGPAYRLERTLVAELFDSLTHVRQMSYNRRVFERALVSYSKHPQLSFVDCYLAACAEVDGRMPLLTFDRNLAKKVSAVELLPTGADGRVAPTSTSPSRQHHHGRVGPERADQD